jgi:hypothetical protein
MRPASHAIYSLRTPILWLGLNIAALAVWLFIAWRVWPWPNYGYCDFPELSWVFWFDFAPRFILLLQLLVFFGMAVRALRRRQFLGSLAVLLTTAAWFALASYDFNPDAQPGVGCMARYSGGESLKV